MTLLIRRTAVEASETIQHEVSDFIAALLDCGCEVNALGTLTYIIDDSNIIPGSRAHLTLQSVVRQYSKRDHMKTAIVEHLRKLGHSPELNKPL